ncbi:hypothetical protein [Chitinophaga sancti]|nr:hypothetical protein [Chitinophaga sancti]WQD63106.1 hypothetical protein U0033_01770 [Chitinophaga sancti]WQG91269.1 hypothetical protein SR876_07145 [Chitinophaga sancti]
MKNILLVIPAILCWQFVRGQHLNKKIIVYKIEKGCHRLVIPDSTLSCGADALAFSLEIGNGKFHSGYDIYWPAPLIDGRYSLAVTEKQLYFRSHHDNPNPDCLFWLTNISPAEYRLICKKIKASKGIFGKPFNSIELATGLSYKHPDPGDEYVTLKSLINLFNEALPADEQIAFPDREAYDSIKAVRIIINTDELYDSEEVSTLP